MRRLLIALLFIFAPLLHAANPADKSVWLGVGAGANQHYMFDLGVPLHFSGAACWGVHVGEVGLNRKTGTEQGQAPGTSIETDFTCLQLGGWSDWGRGYAAAGAEHLQRSVTNCTRNGSTVTPTDRMGAYIKLGYRFSEHLSVYVSAGSQSQLLGGLGLHF
jgi:hypothetical protein